VKQVGGVRFVELVVRRAGDGGTAKQGDASRGDYAAECGRYEHVHFSPEGVVRALRERGVITGYHAEVSLPALNRHVQALLHVQIRPLSRQVIEGFKQYAAALPEVLSVFVVAGGDDFLVHVAVPSVEALHAFLMDKFSKRREIVSFRSSIIYQHSRNQVIAPLPTVNEPSGPEMRPASNPSR
jgi:DNA-binding Lrp family transcriptional regulator